MRVALTLFCLVATVLVFFSQTEKRLNTLLFDGINLLPAADVFTNLSTNVLSTDTVLKDPNKIHRTILFLHGINGHADEFNSIMQLIRRKYGAASPAMYSLDLCEGLCSLKTPLTQQRDDIVEYLVSNAKSLSIDGEDGFNFVAFSQGALLARAVVQKLPPYLRVCTYVSLAGPQKGQWGECNMGKSGIGPAISHKMARPVGWLAFYNPVAQREISVANYWFDPRHNRLFQKEAKFLAEVNGYIDLGDLATQRDNFLKANKTVFLGSPDDDCINPPLSSVFQFVDKLGNPTPLEQSYEYDTDAFGLKTMHDEGRLVMQNFPGYNHLSWLYVPDDKKSQFELYVLPHLQ